MKGQQSNISVFVAEHFQVAPRSSSPDMTTIFHARPYGRFIGIESNLRRKKLIERIKAPIFLDAVFAIKIM